MQSTLQKKYYQLYATHPIKKHSCRVSSLQNLFFVDHFYVNTVFRKPAKASRSTARPFGGPKQLNDKGWKQKWHFSMNNLSWRGDSKD